MKQKEGSNLRANWVNGEYFFSTKDFSFYFMFVCIYWEAVRMFGCLKSPQEGVRSHGARLTGSWESPDTGDEN